MKNLRSKAAKRLGNQLAKHWDLSDTAEQTLLEELLDCFDRLQSHKVVLAKRGVYLPRPFWPGKTLSSVPGCPRRNRDFQPLTEGPEFGSRRAGRPTRPSRRLYAGAEIWRLT